MRAILPFILPALISPAFAQPAFSPAPGSPLILDGAPVSSHGGDFNNDSKPDLLVVLSKPISIEVLTGDNTGRFTPNPPQPIQFPFAPGEVVLADFNADQNLDLAAVTHESYDILLLLGDGKGRFNPAPDSPIASKRGDHPHAHGLLAADVNHDRHIDLLVVHSDPDNQLIVLLNDGRARFAPARGSPFPLGQAPYPPTLGDFNNDNHVDIASPDTQSDPSSLTILLGDGRGAFRPALGKPRLTIARPFFVVATDVDQDKDMDLLVAHDDSSRISILLNDGTASFAPSPRSPFEIGGRAWGIVPLDLNADGKPDFATAGASHVRVFLSTPTGAFVPAPGSPYAVAPGSWRLSIFDLNSDGKPDLITTGVETRHITLLLRN